jgi:pimeloyl-ACP methyl ester carboxylesterase
VGKRDATAATPADRDTRGMPSRYVLVDPPAGDAGPATAVHVHTDGDRAGVPVVMLNGRWSSSWDWDAVVDTLPAGTEWYVVRYDRAGRGRSGALRRPPTLDTELGTLWSVGAAAGARGPVVLVGHGYGGLLAQAAAANQPDRVRGCVLLDPLVPGTRLADRDPEALRRRGRRTHAPLRLLATAAAVTNAVRLAGPLLGRSVTWAGTAGPATGRERPDEWRRIQQRPEILLGAVEEDAAAHAVAAELLALRRTARSSPATPVAVLCGGGGRLRRTRRVSAQRALAAGPRGGTFALLPDAGHLVMVDRPDAVVEALHTLRAGTMTA